MTLKAYYICYDFPFVNIDAQSPRDATDSIGGGSLNDQEDFSDQSEGESYSAPSGEALSLDHSEQLLDADFQVGQI